MDSKASTRSWQSGRRAWAIALTTAVLIGTVSASHARELISCAAETAGGGPPPGLQVQVDPETGTYSMPAPGTLTAPSDGGAERAADHVVTPGTSPAGGYKIRLGDDAASHQEQR